MPRSRLVYADTGYRRPVDSWNAVNVRGDDGLFQHGTVVDADADGLLVDFGCAGQRRVQVEYGKAFRYTYSGWNELQPGCAVEVLMRPEPRRPWMWLPARLITANIPERAHGSLAFVDVSRGGVVRQEVLDRNQVRLPVPPSSADLDRRAIRQGDFVVGSLSPLHVGLAGLLPGSSSLPFCRQLRAYMSYVYRVWPIFISNEQLLFLQSSPIRRSVEERIRLGEGSLGKSMEWCMGSIGLRYCFPALKGGTGEESEQVCQWSLQHLPRHLLAEVFGHLDTMERATYRRVCGAWDALLSGMLSRDIWMSYVGCHWNRRPCDSCSAQLDYRTAAPLYKCVTDQTHRITLLNGGLNGGLYVLWDILRNLTVIGDQLGRFGVDQTVTVVAFQCDLGREGNYPWSNADCLALAMGGGWCRRLLLKQCTMPDCDIPGLRFSGTVSWGSMQGDLWRAAEGQLPVFDVQRVVEWVAQAVQHQSEERDDILEVVNNFTTLHPPLSNGQRPRKWTVENLASLDVTALPRLIQCALSLKIPPNVDKLPGPDAM